MNPLPNIEHNYIDGQWHKASTEQTFCVVNPATEQPLGHLYLSGETEIDQSVCAAQRAFDIYSQFSVEQRLHIIEQLITAYEARFDDMVHAITLEMGAPVTLSQKAQAAVGLGLLKSTREALRDFRFAQYKGSTLIRREPIGVCGLITPWNWPMNQVVCKVAPALASGCTMVLKPSEYAPFSAALFAEMIGQTDLPTGVFNLVYGAAEAGAALAKHPKVDLISVTGSTRAGVAVATAAAPSIKRVTQELGGKSPFIIVPGADLQQAVNSCVERNTTNTGQSCNAATRLLVPQQDYPQVVEFIQQAVAKLNVGDPLDPDTDLGPLVNKAQFERVNHYIALGKNSQATLIAGGHIPAEKGFFVQPTVFGDVTNDMPIAREEIFGPVLSVICYQDLDEAIDIANDTDYGLCAYVFASDEQSAMPVAEKLRAGMVHVNGAIAQLDAPFGGYKMSGNGRERGEIGFDEFLEYKSVFLNSESSK